MGKLKLSLGRASNNGRLKKEYELPVQQPSSPIVELAAVSPKHTRVNFALGTSCGGHLSKVKKKAGGLRLWMRFNRFRQSELIECDKSAIIKLTAIPARDLRILGPVFSHSSNILAREKAIVINLEFIKAIVTAEEVLLVDPTGQGVHPFIDQLRLQLKPNAPQKNLDTCPVDASDALLGGGKFQPANEAVECFYSQLPFEFQVLEIALEVVCTFLDSNAGDLERDAYPVLDELARNVSTINLELVRSLKSNLTRLLARVQKVRDEIEHLLDDNEDMAQLYLTRKSMQNQQSEALLMTPSSNCFNSTPLPRINSNRSSSLLSSACVDSHDVEDLEMLLEAYFMQLDGTRNKILSVREYIDDTEDYVNIQLDNQRNELIQLQLVLTIASFAIAIETLIAGFFGMNIPCVLYNIKGIFGLFVGSVSACSILLFFLVLGYARWKKLIGS